MGVPMTAEELRALADSLAVLAEMIRQQGSGGGISNGAIWILTAAVILLVLEIWRLHGRVDNLLGVHTEHLATIQKVMQAQNQRDDRVAKILSIMCGLWPRANDVIMQQWGDKVSKERHERDLERLADTAQPRAAR